MEQALNDYLRIRRGLGFRLRESESCLRNFVAFLQAEGASCITRELSLRWATLPTKVQPSTWAWRLGMVHVAPGSTVYTDGLGGFAGLHAAGFKHIALKQPLRPALRKGAASVVPLADRAIGNLQHWLIGTYHGVSRAQLQVYLDEFVFRHNRRKQPMAAFQTLLGLGSGRRPTSYRRIRGRRDMWKLLEEA